MPHTFGYETPDYAAYYYFVSFSHLSLGLHIDFSSPNVELHVPFGFFRFGVNSDREVRRTIPDHPNGWVFKSAHVVVARRTEKGNVPTFRR